MISTFLSSQVWLFLDIGSAHSILLTNTRSRRSDSISDFHTYRGLSVIVINLLSVRNTYIFNLNPSEIDPNVRSTSERTFVNL